MSKMSNPFQILLIEDVPVTIKTIEKLISQFSNVETKTCQTVRSAESALKKNIFKIIIFDNDLPDGSGLKMIEEKIENGVITKATCLIAMTSRATKTYINRCKAINADHILKKPFQTLELQSILSQALSRQKNRGNLHI